LPFGTYNLQVVLLTSEKTLLEELRSIGIPDKALIDVNPIQLLNADSPIEVIDKGIVNEVSLGQ